MAALAIRFMQLMADGTRADFDEDFHPDAVNREGKDEPPESRGARPAAFYATALRRRERFSDLAFEVHDVGSSDGRGHDLRTRRRDRAGDAARMDPAITDLSGHDVVGDPACPPSRGDSPAPRVTGSNWSPHARHSALDT
jgi:hypothetical protein